MDKKISEVYIRYNIEDKQGFKEINEGTICIYGDTQYEIYKNTIEWLFTEAVMKGEKLTQLEIVNIKTKDNV
jgi:hypothetical protein